MTSKWQQNKAATRRSVRKRRKELIEFLGGKCTADPDKDGPHGGKLQLHHPDGRSWEPAALNQHRRIAQYWRDALDPHVRLTLHCAHHNASKQPPRGLDRLYIEGMTALKRTRDWLTKPEPTDEEVPF